MNGMRVRKLFRLLGSHSDTVAQRCFLLCDETSRTLSFFFQRSSEGQLHNGRPYLLDMTGPQTSPITACLQYLSGLLSGGPEVSRIVWQSAGHMSMSEWVVACPNAAVVFRRTCLAEASKTLRRHGHFLRHPFVLTTLEDDRSPAQYKEEVIQSFEKLSECCARPGLAKDLKRKSVDMRDARSRDWLLPFALGVTMSLGNTERQHAHNKSFCTGAQDQALWTNVVAQSVLHQAKCIMTATQKAQAAQQAEAAKSCRQEMPPGSSASPLPRAVQAALAPPPAPAAGRFGVGSRRPKARSAVELLKADFVETLRAAGENPKVASKSFWNRCREAWGQLPQERIEVYNQLAESEKVIAREARAVWRSVPSTPAVAQQCLPAPHAPAALPLHPGPQCDATVAVGSNIGALLVGRSQPLRPGEVATPGAGLPTGPPNQEADPLPLSAQVLESYLQQTTLAKLKQKIHSTANIFQQASEYTIPQKVDYGHQCRGLCQKSPATQLGMQGVMWHEWSRVFDSPSKVNSDLLMVYEVYDSDMAADPCHVGFALLTVCACRYGRHAARQDFLRLDVISQPKGLKVADYDACTLGARRAPYVRPHSGLARQFNKFLSGAAGQLDIVSEDFFKSAALDTSSSSQQQAAAGKQYQ